MLDWPGLMRAGLQGLCLQPEAFWKLTPAELFVMLGVGPETGPLDRGRLDELMRRFPDNAKG